MNKIAYDRLLLQAEEAEELGMHKLAKNIKANLPPENFVRDEKSNVTNDELEFLVESTLWSAAALVIDAYDLESVDVLKVNSAIEYMKEKFLKEIKSSLDIEQNILPEDNKVFGEI